MKNINILKEFVSSVRDLSNMKSLRDNFVDFLDFQLFFFCENPTDEQRKWFLNESKSKLEPYKKAMLLFGDGSENYVDVLGEFFMLHITKGEKGQFYTPQYVCEFMSAIVEDKENCNHSVCDTCCGSGRMLLASAKNSDNPHIKQYYANDIDIICVKMCLLNLLVNSLSGVVTWGDGLVPLWMESRDTFILSTKMIYIDSKFVNVPQYKQYSKEETKDLFLFPEPIPNPEKSIIKPSFSQIEFTEKVFPIAKGEQLSLF